MQLQIVMHLANGDRLSDIATELNCSWQNVAKHVGLARKKTEAKTLPHLVSIVIAKGDLEWTPEGRVVNADVRTTVFPPQAQG